MVQGPPQSLEGGSDLFERGLELFNSARFFECHEVWEELWRPEHGHARLFLQALIHFAVAFHHCQCGNQSGAERQLVKGLKKLAGFLPSFHAIDALALYHEGEACLEVVQRGLLPESFPVICKNTVLF
jgi:predicted metal-dependent hydrolase